MEGENTIRHKWNVTLTTGSKDISELLTRCTDQTTDSVLLHKFRHVNANHVLNRVDERGVGEGRERRSEHYIYFSDRNKGKKGSIPLCKVICTGGRG